MSHHPQLGMYQAKMSLCSTCVELCIAIKKKLAVAGETSSV